VGDWKVIGATDAGRGPKDAAGMNGTEAGRPSYPGSRRTLNKFLLFAGMDVDAFRTGKPLRISKSVRGPPTPRRLVVG
jgi:hypothetical protein